MAIKFTRDRMALIDRIITTAYLNYWEKNFQTNHKHRQTSRNHIAIMLIMRHRGYSQGMIGRRIGLTGSRIGTHLARFERYKSWQSQLKVKGVFSALTFERVG